MSMLSSFIFWTIIMTKNVTYTKTSIFNFMKKVKEWSIYLMYVEGNILHFSFPFNQFSVKYERTERWPSHTEAKSVDIDIGNQYLLLLGWRVSILIFYFYISTLFNEILNNL